MFLHSRRSTSKQNRWFTKSESIYGFHAQISYKFCWFLNTVLAFSRFSRVFAPMLAVFSSFRSPSAMAQSHVPTTNWMPDRYCSNLQCTMFCTKMEVWGAQNYQVILLKPMVNWGYPLFGNPQIYPFYEFKTVRVATCTKTRQEILLNPRASELAVDHKPPSDWLNRVSFYELHVCICIDLYVDL